MIPELLGPHLAELNALIPILAQEEGPLLILGEEGVGKSLFARHIHAAAEELSRELPIVNLATASARNGWLSLLGSDFESLTSTRRSALEHDGIVLIKHIGAAPRSVQDQLTEALRTGCFTRPGAVHKARVACRPIFTLRIKGAERYNHTLLSQNLFRYLSQVRKVTIPPLRERPGDIQAIARHALGRTLSPELEKLLLAYGWPGNVTELKASLLILRPLAGGKDRPADGCLLEVATVLLGIEERRESSLKDAMARLEQKLATHALLRTEGHMTQAAQLLGLTRNALRYCLHKGRPPS